MNLDPITAFRAFLNTELRPAANEISGLKDRHRKHIQKLMFTNLVDRFDTMVDLMLLQNCREEHLTEKAFKGLDQPVTESSLLKLLMRGDALQDALDNRLQDSLRLSVLRSRHSRKLVDLFALLGDPLNDYERVPRVNHSTGRILASFTVQNKSTPASICGYADWLYSKRNAIVHGAGSSKFLENDRKQIKKHYGVEVRSGFHLRLSSVTNATEFYEDVCDLLADQ